MLNPLRGVLNGPSYGTPPQGGAGFNPFAAGAKSYGTQGAPNVGAVSGQGMQGYNQRSNTNQLYRDALNRISGGF